MSSDPDQMAYDFYADPVNITTRGVGRRRRKLTAAQHTKAVQEFLHAPYRVDSSDEDIAARFFETRADRAP